MLPRIKSSLPRTVAEWRCHGEGRNLRCRSGRRGIQQYLDLATMTLTNRALGLEDFRPEKSAAGLPIPVPPERKPASLCHYYRGTFRCVNVQIVARHETFNFTDLTFLPSKENRWTTGQLADNPLGGWIILRVLSFFFPLFLFLEKLLDCCSFASWDYVFKDIRNTYILYRVATEKLKIH